MKSLIRYFLIAFFTYSPFFTKDISSTLFKFKFLRIYFLKTPRKALRCNAYFLTVIPWHLRLRYQVITPASSSHCIMNSTVYNVLPHDSNFGYSIVKLTENKTYRVMSSNSLFLRDFATVMITSEPLHQNTVYSKLNLNPLLT